MCSQRARTEYPIFTLKNRGRLLSSPPTASAASLDISPGRSNFRTEIRHPAVPQNSNRDNPGHNLAAIGFHTSTVIDKSPKTRAPTRKLTLVAALASMPVPASCRMTVCDNRMDLLGVAGHGVSLTASISRSRHAGTRRHMQYGSSGVRAVTAQPLFSKIPDYQP